MVTEGGLVASGFKRYRFHVHKIRNFCYISFVTCFCFGLIAYQNAWWWWFIEGKK
jgi:hypothetical protein